MSNNKILKCMIFSVVFLLFSGCNSQNVKIKNHAENTCIENATSFERNINMKYNKLTEEEKIVILRKGTEMPFMGEFTHNKEKGIYLCKQCDTPLFVSGDKFESESGWPSFDDAIEGRVKKIPDPDGRRTEIVCSTCGGHLGHVFFGERFTPKNTRYCVNSISMKFQNANDKIKTETKKYAYFASGCFWGTEYWFMKNYDVKTDVGYMGGIKYNPTYQEVSSGRTGHVETVRVEYDPLKINYEDLVKLFFETHDYSQTDGQGPDIGSQYLSVIFYNDENEKKIAEKYIGILKKKGFVATSLKDARKSKFWIAEDYHQEYYKKKKGTPYCHTYKKIF